MMRQMPMVAQGPVMAPQYVGSFMAPQYISPNLLGNPNKPMIDRLNGILDDKDTLKKNVKEAFQGCRGKDDDLYIETFKNLVQVIDQKMGVPPQCFGNLALCYDRFDYNGDGWLNERECQKLVKFMIKEYRKDLGGAPDVEVRFEESPEKAGYTLIKVLASGGQGEARLVTDKKGKKVVLKTYSKANANAGGIDDLKAEMENMNAVKKCDNVATCFEIFQDARNFYMVSGANFGGDFASILEKAKEAGVKKTEAWFKNLFTQCFTGLAYMHEHALMHCDIKEPNLMIRNTDYKNPEVVLIDLGLAQVSADQDAQGTCGTPGYIPPETWESGYWYPRGDMFSMGVVCIQLLTNKVPNEKTGKMGIFTEGCMSMDDVKRATATKQPDYSKVESKYPEVMDWLPMCLEKNRKNRPKAPVLLEEDWFQEDDGACADGCTVQ